MKKSKRVFSAFLALIMVLSCFVCLGMLSSATLAEKNWVVAEESEYEDGVKISKRTYKYDSNGNMLSSVYKTSDGYSKTSVCDYDSKGNILKETFKDSDGVESIDLYEYDKNGNIIKHVEDSTGDYPTVNTYEYDSRGNTIKEATENDGYTETYIYKYDKKGNMLKDAYETSDGEFYSYEYAYDSKGNEISISYKNSEGNYWTFTNEYDSKGNLIKETYREKGKWNYSSTYEYDSKGNCIKEKYKTKTGYVGITAYTYDSNGKFIKRTYKNSDGEWEKWAAEYDSKGNEIKEVYKTSRENYSFTYTYKYNSLGLMTEINFKDSDGDNDTSTFKYDPSGKLLSRKYESENSSGKYVYAEAYTYDKTGNVVKYVNKDNSGYTVSRTYAYDEQGNRVKEKYKNADGYYEALEYDKYGNITKQVVYYSDDETEYKTVRKYTLVNGAPDISDCDISVELSADSFVYDGEAKYPTVDVIGKFSGNEYDYFYLERGIDYTVKYTNNIKVGTATVTVKFKGCYSGTLKKTFKIVPQSTSVSSVTAGTKKMTVKWNKQGKQTTGYQIQYSTSSNFAANSTQTITIKDNATTSKTISSLKSGTKYYVRVRTYKTVDGKNYNSSWSAKKTVTVK